jgi:GNAT superfamily N-acetyltransferase
MSVSYRKATLDDVPNLCKFTDLWLSRRKKIPGLPRPAGDYFVTPSQHTQKIKYGTVWLAIDSGCIVGWGAKGRNDSLFYLLVDPRRRGEGIGHRLLKLLDPSTVRSKQDQSSGNPINFYLKNGYELIESSTGKKHNIDILKKT